MSSHLNTKRQSPRTPGRFVYFALLASSILASLSSTSISSPLYAIAEGLNASANDIVLALSVFTLSMVVCAPFAGWLCDRLGTTRALLSGLFVMTAVQVLASVSQQLWHLIALRIVLGAACSIIPPAVQRAFGHFWPLQRGRTMAAWSSSIGVGQALGPPLGGFISDGLGWRAVFWGHGIMMLVLAVLIMMTVPRIQSGRPALHLSGLATLVLGVGSLTVVFTWIGQGSATESMWILLAVAALGLGGHAIISWKSTVPMIPLSLIQDFDFLRANFGGAAVMTSLGVVIVAIPLQLVGEVGMNPGPIGLVMFALAGAMALFAPIASRIAEKTTSRLTILGGFSVLMVSMALLAYFSRGDFVPSSSLESGVALTVTLLFISGCCLGAVQAISAYTLISSQASEYGIALGLHNMLRFSGLAAGYAWAAWAFGTKGLWLVYLGPAAIALLGIALFLSRPTDGRRVSTT